MYGSYWSLSDFEQGLNKILIKSKLRINTRNCKDAYLSDRNDTTQTDVYIEDIKDRNRALQGDFIASHYKKKFECKILENFNQNVVFVDIKQQNN